MSYIYFCRSKHQPNKGYIGLDSRTLSQLARIREHIDAAYSPNSHWDGCAEVIRASGGCCEVEWAFFNAKQNYGLPKGVLEDFKKHWTTSATDLELAEILHIVGSHMTNNISARYNKQIGGGNADLTYNWPANDKYALALKDIFKLQKLPDITIVRFNPASAWQKAVYPGQYQILKEFVDRYINKKLSNDKFLKLLCNEIATLSSFQQIVNEYIRQYIKQTFSDNKKLIFKENTITKTCWKELVKDVEDSVNDLVWNQNDIKITIDSLRGYGIHVNKTHFNWKVLATNIVDILQEKMTGPRRQQTFAQIFEQELSKLISRKLKNLNSEQLTRIYNEVINITAHKLYNNTQYLSFGPVNHSFFYQESITPFKEQKPEWAKSLSNYSITWGITSAQQNKIIQWSRFRIYRIIDKITLSSYWSVVNADRNRDFLMSRLHSFYPFSKIQFVSWTDWAHEVLTAYTIEYKKHRWTPVVIDDGKIARGAGNELGLKQYITRDDLFNLGEPVLYSGDMIQLMLNFNDTKKYY